MGLRYVAPGIEVDSDSILSIQEINGAKVVRLKDGGVITAPSQDHRMNLGEMIVYQVLAKRLSKLPQLDPTQPYGLHSTPSPSMSASEIQQLTVTAVRETFAKLNLDPTRVSNDTRSTSVS